MAAVEPISILVAVPGGKPVMEEPRPRPREQVITVAPKLVTVWAAQTPQLTAAAPRESFARVDIGVRRTRAANMRDVGMDIADERKSFGWLMQRSLKGFQVIGLLDECW